MVILFIKQRVTENELYKHFIYIMFVNKNDISFKTDAGQLAFIVGTRCIFSLISILIRIMCNVCVSYV